MDFAEKQLTKHGWKSGDGLGKSRHGIKEPIKAQMKFDTTGMGHDKGEEFTYHWWDHVFNKAASNIQVQESNEGVEIKNTKDTKVSKSKSKTYASKSMLYGQFVKGATLSGGTESRDPDLPSEEEEEPATKHCLLPSNEEEVFKMCGGRTAHKGARHGLKLNGKLQRIMEQERLQSESRSNSPQLIKDNKIDTANDIGTVVEVPENDSGSRKKSKKKKRKHKDNDQDFAGVEEAENGVEENEEKQSKSKKNKLNEEVADNARTDITESNDCADIYTELSTKKRKKSKKKKGCKEEKEFLAYNKETENESIVTGDKVNNTEDVVY